MGKVNEQAPKVTLYLPTGLGGGELRDLWRLDVGRMVLRGIQGDSARVWIGDGSGEGGAFKVADLEASIQEFYDKHF